MTITCPKCKAKLALPDEKLRAGATKFKCSKCGTSLLLKGKGGTARKEGLSEGVSSPSSKTLRKPATPQPTLEEERQPAPDREAPERPKPSDAGLSPVGPPPHPKQDTQPEFRKKEETAHDVLKQPSTIPVKEEKAALRRAWPAALAGAILLLLAAIFLFRPANKVSQERSHAPAAVRTTTDSGSSVVEKAPQDIGSETDSGDSPTEGDLAERHFNPIPSYEMNEEKAIELVKKSDALLKNTPVEEIIEAWTKQNASQYELVGWQAKKINERKYLVSYTARRGELTKGFYFDLDIDTGSVQDLAHNPELQKEYNIQYGN